MLIEDGCFLLDLLLVFPKALLDEIDAGLE